MSETSLAQQDQDRETKLELYKMAVQARAMEIGLLWQRSNYLLVLNTAIAAGFVSLRPDNAYLSVPLCFIGFLVAMLWLAVNLGGKFWQCRWERRARLAEENYAPGADLFSANWQVVVADVEADIHVPSPKGNRWIEHCFYWVRCRHREAILARPSVTEALTLLSVVFMCFWAAAFLFSLVGLGVSLFLTVYGWLHLGRHS